MASRGGHDGGRVDEGGKVAADGGGDMSAGRRTRRSRRRGGRGRRSRRRAPWSAFELRSLSIKWLPASHAVGIFESGGDLIASNLTDSHQRDDRGVGDRDQARTARTEELAWRRPRPACAGAVVGEGDAAPPASWVAITPEVTSRAVCRKIISELVNMYKDSHLGRLTPAYDGRKSLYTAGALPFTSQQFKIKLAEKDRGDKEFGVTIKYAGRADLHHLQQFLHGRQFDAPQETIQVLDVVLREYPSQNYVTVARSFFSKELGATKDIGDGLECWRGYYQSLRPTQMGLSLNIDIAATSFYKSISVIAFAKEYLNMRDAPRTLTEKQRIALKKALRGVRVEVTHRKDCRRRYKINGLTNEPLGQLMFPVDDKGNKMRVVQYFQEKYRCKLDYLTWPCIQCGSDSRPTHLPMEVCKIVEGQRFSKKLNEKQVTEILRATCQRPDKREKSIWEMVMENKYEDDKYAQEFGIKVAKQLTSVEARVLPPPMLKYHDSGKEKTCNPRVGAWNMINKKMVNGGKIDSWACVSFSRNLHPDAVNWFCQSLFGVCNNIGMSIARDPVIKVLYERANNVEGALRTVHAQATTALRGGTLQLLLIILPEISGSYGTIKRVCETELGLISQCCLPKHVQACKPQYMENVALKINVKAGGRNTVLSDALNRRMPFVSDKPTIIFGADVTHPQPGEDSSASIAAVVASMDWPEVTKYKGLISSQPHRQEIIKDLYTTTQDSQKGIISGGMISYARCTRSVSVVPPAYYAHLAAFRARYYVEGDSDVGSSSVGGTRVKSGDIRPIPRVKDNVKEVMFYC
ncbi:uncharacterized protein A4U43_C03F19770 [Asparagus officinalis]|uniref:Piwi domain-containing protein n=1 Tax=Asparagus officinalis TaxID=4686 RepID=A0A5P1FDA5_ASPOF|nr:uncharacterized protein A4U43_C03F19770 [Asparagus officinalis]